MHNIFHLKYPKNTNKKQILLDVERIAREDGDGHYGKITFHDNIICDSEEEAIEKIKQLDNGWYDDHAVLYRDYDNVKPTAAMIKINEKKKTLFEQKKVYISSHLVKDQKADFIGCKSCGSKIARKYMNSSNKCPVCFTDMRSKTVLDKIEWYDKKREELDSKYKELQKAQKDKAELCWCVKIEYHS